MNYQKTILNNGIRVISEEVKNFKSISLGVCFSCGSRDETKEENGISHFIEHLLFKGTTTRTAKDIAIAIDSIGGEINGYTTIEFMYIYAKFLSEHLDIVWSVISDIINNSKFDEKDIEIEKNVIAEEIKSFNDSPYEQAFHLLFESIYEPHSISFPIMGTENNVRKLTRDSILQFWRKHYVGENVIIAAAGDVEHKKIVELASALSFNNVNSPYVNDKKIPNNKPSYKKLIKKDISQLHLAIGTKTIPYNSEKKYAWLILETLIGGSMSSRLFQNIREDKGLVYEISSFLKLLKDTGVFGVYLVTDPKNKEKAINSIWDEFNKFKNELKEEEVTMAKEQLKGNLLLNLESTTSIMHRLLVNELYMKKYIPCDESIEKIKKVKKDEIIEIAEENFVPEIYFKSEVIPDLCKEGV